MKIPLAYQKTEYDCGPISVLNALSVLFERESIPPELLKSVVLYSLDAYNARGEYAKSGTSRMAMSFIAGWIEHFGQTNKFPVHTEYLSGAEVFFGEGSSLNAALQRGGSFHMVKMLVREQQVVQSGSGWQGACHPFGHAHRCIHRNIAILGLDEVAIAPHGTTGVYLNFSAHARILPAFYPLGEPKVRQ